MKYWIKSIDCYTTEQFCNAYSETLKKAGFPVQTIKDKYCFVDVKSLKGLSKLAKAVGVTIGYDDLDNFLLNAMKKDGVLSVIDRNQIGGILQIQDGYLD